MATYIIRRLIQGFAVLVTATVLIYFLLTLIPGGPLGEGARCGARPCTPAELCALRSNMGIVSPPPECRPYAWYERYFIWLFDPSKAGVDVQIGPLHIHGAGMLTGDWGRSRLLGRGRTVISLIGDRLPFTLLLTGSALLLSLLLAIPIGIISAVKQYSKLDHMTTLFSFFGLSLPAFWFGWMLIIVFAVQFKHWHDDVPWLAWLPYLPPASAYDPGHENDILNRIWHLILPVSVLSLLSVANWSRFLRASVLEVLRLDYVRTAWAKGLAQRRVILTHALRNALIPVITLVGLAVPGLFGGAVIIETVFSYPGLGLLYLDAIQAYDWPVLMGFLLIVTALTIFGNLLADILYSVVDPRIRLSNG